MDQESNGSDSVAGGPPTEARSTMDPDAQSVAGDTVDETAPPSPAAAPAAPESEPAGEAASVVPTPPPKKTGRARKGQPRTANVKEGAEAPLEGDNMPQTPELGKRMLCLDAEQLP